MPKLRLTCPECEARIATENLSATAWKCWSCQAEVPNPFSGDTTDQLTNCRACGNTEMYVQKAFPNWLGMGIVVVASLGFLVFHWMYWFYAAWACLFAAAILDTFLYFFMGNVTVCYRCRAEHLGFPVNPRHGSFDLGVAEKYRQERLRKQLLSERSASPSLPSEPP
jgi:DNA-directed RNA polymerase subunit RPC12/RpoP